MADEKRIIGWFYRNGKRIPITEKKGMENATDASKTIAPKGKDISKTTRMMNNQKRFNAMVANIEREDQIKKNIKSSESKAKAARVKDLMKQGIDKEIAKAMAEGELSSGLLKPVVY